MLLTKVPHDENKAQLDERSFEQLLAAAYMLQQQRESIPFVSARPQPAMNEAERLAAIAEAQALVHGNQLRLQKDCSWLPNVLNASRAELARRSGSCEDRRPCAS